MNDDSRRKHNTKAVIAASVLLLSLCAPSFLSPSSTVLAGATWTVDSDGFGLRSIQQAIDKANSGDTILVFSGVYYEHLIVDKSLSIVGENQDNTIIDGSDTGNVITVAADNVAIKGFTIRHGTVGVKLVDGKNGNTLFENRLLSNAYYGVYGDLCGETVIANNNISFNGWHGIFLYGSKPCVLDNNFIMSNGIDGMFIRPSNSNTITENLVSDNGVCGIHIYSDEDPIRARGLSKDNTIENNHVLKNPCGIKIEHIGTDVSPARNGIYENSIAHNDLGLNISNSNSNSISHNNFINNSRQLHIQESFNNNWNSGYYPGGNYWSDHNSTDIYWGESQNETGSDGIIDIPYLVSPNPNEKDTYPFAYENGWFALPEIVLDSPSNRTYVSRALPLILTTNKPARLSYSLDAQANVTLLTNLVLETLPVGAHTMAVYASDSLGNMVSSETSFTITFLGDLNMDWTVNIVDVSIVARSYGCIPGSERWNPDADLDENGIINVLDVSLVAKDYGRKI